MIEDSWKFDRNTELLAVYAEPGEQVPVPPDSMVTQAGRKLFRHPNGQGTVMVYDYWGKESQLFVPDAKYRATSKSYDSAPKDHGLYKVRVTMEYFSDLPELKTYDTGDDNPTTLDINFEPLPYFRNDVWVQKTYADLKNDGTAKYNTDKLMTFSTTDAAHYCRSVDIPGIGKCDMPNLYQLIILYLESDNIDKLDPTVSSHALGALGLKNTNGRFNFDRNNSVRSSSEFDARRAWAVYHVGYAYDINGYGDDTQKRVLGCVPVKELI